MPLFFNLSSCTAHISMFCFPNMNTILSCCSKSNPDLMFQVDTLKLFDAKSFQLLNFIKTIVYSPPT